jgi:hypothetical protein
MTWLLYLPDRRLAGMGSFQELNLSFLVTQLIT